MRSCLELDYSYDPANYHPLGIRLFSAEDPAAGHAAAGDHRGAAAAAHVRRARSRSARGRKGAVVLRAAGRRRGEPVLWNFDLCSVTLGNFKYRKMSLVRDYEALLDDQPPNPAFDATFSLAPREPTRPLPAVPPLEDRYYVVACDPTQASAIEEARDRQELHHPGPAGDRQVADDHQPDRRLRGPRQARAVRLREARGHRRGLRPPAAARAGRPVLPDPRHADRQTRVRHGLEADVRGAAGRLSGPLRRDGPARRRALLKRLQDELRPLELFDAAMQQTPPSAGLPAAAPAPPLHRAPRPAAASCRAIEQERLPDYVAWWQYRERIDELAERIREIAGRTASWPIIRCGCCRRGWPTRSGRWRR